MKETYRALNLYNLSTLSGKPKEYIVPTTESGEYIVKAYVTNQKEVYDRVVNQVRKDFEGSPNLGRILQDIDKKIYIVYVYDSLNQKGVEDIYSFTSNKDGLNDFQKKLSSRQDLFPKNTDLSSHDTSDKLNSSDEDFSSSTSSNNDIISETETIIETPIIESKEEIIPEKEVIKEENKDDEENKKREEDERRQRIRKYTLAELKSDTTKSTEYLQEAIHFDISTRVKSIEKINTAIVLLIKVVDEMKRKRRVDMNLINQIFQVKLPTLTSLQEDILDYLDSFTAEEFQEKAF